MGDFGRDDGPAEWEFCCGLIGSTLLPQTVQVLPEGSAIVGSYRGACQKVGERIRLCELEEDGYMKNTGKRIFYSVAFVALMSLPALVSAVAPASTR